MCYSAQVQAAYDKYVKKWGADISLQEFARLYFHQEKGSKTKTPKAMDAAFASHSGELEQAIWTAIQGTAAAQIAALEQDLFKQKKRLADAARTLQTKTTKKALEDQRIASTKIEWIKGKLADIKRTEPKEKDSRIFPGWYAPVMIQQEGRRVVLPMRYQ